MEDGRASVSAMGSAVLRAAHVWEDTPPWVIQDTESVKLLTDVEIARMKSSMINWPREVRAGFRLTHAVRTRVAEDVAILQMQSGRSNYVILGAGLDSFTWRHPAAANLRIFEVDHPATQGWKRKAMERAGVLEPPNVTYVAADFLKNRIQNLHLPSLATWNWLGVTMYLKKIDTSHVLREIASMDSGTVLVANFLLAPEERSDLGNALQSVAKRVLDTVGEPVLASYTRSEVESLLADSGFSSFELLDSDALSEKYLRGRDDLLLPSSTVIAVATV
ncbi:MAG TPA: class I SAM-dependent methyltransferase [Acidimicrobiales bacterium]